MKRFLAALTVFALLLVLLTGCGDPIEITLGNVDSQSSENSDGTETNADNSGENQSETSASANNGENAEENSDSESESEPEPVVDNRTITEKYADANANYQNVKGWINIPNTYVDQAIVQSGDNAYYLDKNLSGSYYWYGSVFADYRNNVESSAGLDQNTVLFGHNKADGLMFGNLTKYEGVSWAQNHPIIRTAFGGEEQTWLVIAAMDCETSFDYIKTALSDYDLQEIRNRSYIDVDYSASSSDKFLTLSTCTYKYKLASGKYREDVRFVVVAVLADSGASASISANNDRVEPNLA